MHDVCNGIFVYDKSYRFFTSFSGYLVLYVLRFAYREKNNIQNCYGTGILFKSEGNAPYNAVNTHSSHFANLILPKTPTDTVVESLYLCISDEQ